MRDFVECTFDVQEAWVGRAGMSYVVGKYSHLAGGVAALEACLCPVECGPSNVGGLPALVEHGFKNTAEDVCKGDGTCFVGKRFCFVLNEQV